MMEIQWLSSPDGGGPKSVDPHVVLKGRGEDTLEDLFSPAIPSSLQLKDYQSQSLGSMSGLFKYAAS